jgi:hypothetical protein
MCLTLKSDKTRVKTAKSDIVVYKKLKKDHLTPPFSLLLLKDGEEFSGIIKSISCNGKISIENNYAYFCINELSLDGGRCNNRQGYKYSWALDEDVKLIKTSTVELKNEDLYNIKTPYEDFIVKEGATYNSPLIKIGNEIFEGLHTFKEKPNSSIWAECIIPKGSKYYEGEFNDIVSYASDTLKYVKIYEE